MSLEGGHPTHAGFVSSGNVDRNFAVRCDTCRTESVRESTGVSETQTDLLSSKCVEHKVGVTKTIEGSVLRDDQDKFEN